MGVQIQISLTEYLRLTSRDEILSALEKGGVEDWEWYDEALEKAGVFEDYDDEEEED